MTHDELILYVHELEERVIELDKRWEKWSDIALQQSEAITSAMRILEGRDG